MQPKQLHEAPVYWAHFEQSPGGKDHSHTIIVCCDSIQAALLACGELLPLTDCKLASVEKMGSVRGVIV